MSHFIYYIFSALFSFGLFLVLDALYREYCCKTYRFSNSLDLVDCITWQAFLALDLRKVFGLTILQNSILIFYLALGKTAHCHHPILTKEVGAQGYCAPLPHVLMLTAIVVGFAVLCVALAISYKSAMMRGHANKRC
ncbi:Na(+)/H(+) antiporter subunit C [Rickettsiales endosymbiont of Paramecium tredecaurelia]|uniref:sodium:proton antiporter n=1 Tax=Candidatus Sarmatiella mevalonica TaxID=2770581 RepID=UPI001924E3AA|nr:cation:proton antiporter subunit C [Candidatus Sarmatiella mevalonica]MBL3284413.1 Na(+)/H(+) antiporter subunit C [Candidatus Sarmatiella mevalonica]